MKAPKERDSEMTDLVDGVEKRNYGIRKKNGISAYELFWTFFPLVLIMGTLIFHLWVRGQIVKIGYEIQDLAEHEEALTRTREKLILNEEVLYSPERIDRIARGRLGMEPLRPEQVLTPRISHVPMDRSVMAGLVTGN